jgi:ABC-2 type transport system ATP-binding protein
MMRRLLTACVLLSTMVLAPLTPAHAAGDDRVGANAPYSYTTRDLTIAVPDPDMLGNPVVLDARVLVPTGPGPFAGLLINHGYLGSKSDDGDTAVAAVQRGYIVLRYSSRGFGNTKGQVDLVGGPETRDMVTAIGWLNNPANVPIWVDHIGHYGGSYGGAHDYQLALQNLDAVKAFVPAATWTDLWDGLVPNGVLKLAYLSGFYAAGRDRTDGYNNYDPEIDTAYANALASADLDGLHTLMKAHSVAGKWDRIHKPMFLVQGLNDGLFDGNEAIQTYVELTKRHVPVRLYLGGIGHPPARSGGGNEIAHVGVEVQAFLDHYVRGIDNGIDTAPPVEFGLTRYFGNQDFGAGDSGVLARVRATSAVPVGDSLPFGSTTALHVCGSTTPGQGSLTTAACPAGAVPVLLAAGTGGKPGDEPVAGKLITEGYKQNFGQAFPNASTPVDVVNLDGPTLTLDTTYAGIPRLHLSVLSDPPTTGLGGPTPPAAAYQVDPKIYDVAPDGTATLITRGAFAEQPGGGAPGVHTASFDAFALAWTFAAGHHLRLSLSSADVPYLRPNSAAFQVAIMPDASTIDLPGAESATPQAYGITSPDPAPVVPEAPVAALMPLLGLVVVGVVYRRRRLRA